MNCSDSSVIIIECCYFFVKKQILPKKVEKLFQENEVFEGVSDFQRTVTGANKFKGVYLISFSSEKFARNFVEMDVEINGILLNKFLLPDYKTRSFKLNQDYIMENLKDVKIDTKLDNCNIIQVNAEEEDVPEHFCGISSYFVDTFEFPVEEVKVITSPKIPQYVLMFESSEGTNCFKKQPEYHKDKTYTGKGVEGKNDILELLKEDLESWCPLGGLKLKNKSDDAFLKKIKKQISLVLFEDQYNVAS